MGGARLPPDKLHERNVDSSNATLNTLFGSARQKSWMVGGATPVRPTPRPSESRTTTNQTSGMINYTTTVNSPDKPTPRTSNARSVAKNTVRDATGLDTDTTKNKLLNKNTTSKANSQISLTVCSDTDSVRSSKRPYPETCTIPIADTGIFSPGLDQETDVSVACPNDEPNRALKSVNPESTAGKATESGAPKSRLATQSERNIDCLKNNLTQALSRSSSKASSPLIPGARAYVSPTDTQSDRNVRCSIDETPGMRPSRSEVPKAISDESQAAISQMEICNDGNFHSLTNKLPRTESLLHETSMNTASIMSAELGATHLSQIKSQGNKNLHDSKDDVLQIRSSLPEIPVTTAAVPEATVSQMSTQNDPNIRNSAHELSRTRPSRFEVPTVMSSEVELANSRMDLYRDGNWRSSTDESFRRRSSLTEKPISAATELEVTISHIDKQNDSDMSRPIDEKFRPRFPLPGVPMNSIAQQESSISRSNEKSLPRSTNEITQELIPSGSEKSSHTTRPEAPFLRSTQDESYVISPASEPPRLPRSVNSEASPLIIPESEITAFGSEEQSRRNIELFPYRAQPLLVEASTTRTQLPSNFDIYSPTSTSPVENENSNILRQIGSPREEQPNMIGTSRVSSSSHLTPLMNSEANSPPFQMQQISSTTRDFVNNKSHSLMSTPKIPVTSLKSGMLMIEAQLKSVGGIESLNTGLERPRFQLIMEACNHEDFFYVTLHQLFVAWDFKRSEVVGLPGVLDTKILHSGFTIIAKLIHGNDQLAPNHKRWFADFPVPLSEFWKFSDQRKKIFFDVFFCLEKLTNNWLNCMLECKSRGFPLLVDEITTKLGIFSPILQGVLFTAARRNIGIRDEKTSHEMDQVFKKDQTEYQIIASRLGTANPPTIMELQSRNSALIHRYQTIHTQYQRRLSGSNANQPSLAHQSPVPGHSNPNFTRRISSPKITSHAQAHLQTSWMPTLPTSNTWHPGNQPQSTRTGQPLCTPTASKKNKTSANKASNHTQQNHVPLQRLSINSPEQSTNRSNPDFRNNSVPIQTSQSRQRQYVGVSSQGNFLMQNNSRPNQTQAMPQSMPQPVSHPTPQTISQPISQPIPQQLQGQVVTTPHWQNSTLPRQPQSNQYLHQIQHQHLQRLSQAHQAQLQRQQQIISRQHQHLASLQSVSFNPVIAPTQLMNPPIEVQQPPTRNININGNSMGLSLNSTSRNSSVSSNGPPTPGNNPFMSPTNFLGPTQVPTVQKYISNKIKDDIQVYHQTPILNRSIVPPLNWVHPPNMLGINRPELNALHQVLLRSPQLIPAASNNMDKLEERQANRYYQAVRGFALEPSIIPNTPISKFEFGISETDICCIPVDTTPKNGSTPTRKFKHGSLQFRLRCVQTKKSEINISVHEWVVKSTTWPEGTCLDINRNQLEIRRKAHYGKDLPIDITQNILHNGTMLPNLVTCSIGRGRNTMSECNYFLAVEIIEILEHSQVVDLCQRINRLPISDTLDKIKKSLTSPADDDYEIVICEISINLADPFTACIFEIPVRGSSCLHRECFDLETFLRTRIKKPNRPSQPCMVDVWKCPLCGRDARPWELQVDGYLESVRKVLADQDNLDVVKSIRVKPDGSWHPKVEKRKEISNNQESENYCDEESPASRNVKQKKSIEVISLDDD